MWQYYLFQAVPLWVGQACLFLLTSFCWPHPSAVCTASVWSLVHIVLQAYEGKSERLCHGPGQALRKGKAWKAMCRLRSALVFCHFHLPRAKPITNCPGLHLSGRGWRSEDAGEQGCVSSVTAAREAECQQLRPGLLRLLRWLDGMDRGLPQDMDQNFKAHIFCYSTEESGLELGRYPPWLL